MARAIFFRGKGAYLVGRIRRGRFTDPARPAARERRARRGARRDPLQAEEDVSIVFSFTRSYFHVDAPRPRELIAFLSSLMPQKRVSELYIALGYNKHGKTELYREIVRHIAGDRRAVRAGPRRQGAS